MDAAVPARGSYRRNSLGHPKEAGNDFPKYIGRKIKPQVSIVQSLGCDLMRRERLLVPGGTETDADGHSGERVPIKENLPGLRPAKNRWARESQGGPPKTG